MQKKFLFIFSFLIILGFSSSAVFGFDIVVKGGLDVAGEIEDENNYSADIETGFSFSGEFLADIFPLVQAGIGAEGQIMRCSDEPGASKDNKFGFIPLYGMFRVPFDLQIAKPFAAAKIGYNFFIASDEFEANNGSDNKGGLYWGIGGGVIAWDVVFELSYSQHLVKISSHKFTYSKVMLAVGYDFSL